MEMAVPIQSYEATTLTFGETGRLACLYVVIDGRSDPKAAAFLQGWHGCCDVCELDWQAVRRPASALIGIELGHCCDRSDERLRLVFDVRRDSEALEHLANTEALVVGLRPYGSFANAMAAYGVDGNAVRRAVRSAERGLRSLASAAS